MFIVVYTDHEVTGHPDIVTSSTHIPHRTHLLSLLGADLCGHMLEGLLGGGAVVVDHLGHLENKEDERGIEDQFLWLAGAYLETYKDEVEFSTGINDQDLISHRPCKPQWGVRSWWDWGR